MKVITITVLETADVAEITKQTPRSIQRAVQSGKLRSIARFGDALVFDPLDVRDYCKAQMEKGEQQHERAADLQHA